MPKESQFCARCRPSLAHGLFSACTLLAPVAVSSKRSLGGTRNLARVLHKRGFGPSKPSLPLIEVLGDAKCSKRRFANRAIIIYMTTRSTVAWMVKCVF